MKKELRKKIIKQRMQDNEKDKMIVEKLKQLIEGYKNILVYYPLKEEINILDILNNKNYNFYLPYCFNNNIEVRKFTSFNNLENDEEGILSSVTKTNDEMDVVVVPAVAMNRKMYRLGYGKGYYDRFLKDKNVLKIGLVYDIFIIEEDFQDEWDICFDYIITEKEIIKRK